MIIVLEHNYPDAVEDIVANHLRVQLSDGELAIVRALSEGAKLTDELIELTGREASDVLADLTLLELEGYVQQNEESRFELCP